MTTRRPRPSQSDLRVVVRHVGDGRVRIDGPSRPIGPIPRRQLGAALTGLLQQTGQPLTVELHTPDGTVHTDRLTPPPDHPHTADTDKAEGGAVGPFLPGETVHVAVIVHTTTTDPTGRPTPAQDHHFAGQVGSTVLVGMLSGVTIMRPVR